MATLKLIQFSGEIPRLVPRLLPDTAAQRAENVRLDDGGLTPVRAMRFEQAITGHTTGNIKSIIKHGADWLAFDTVVNAAPGAVAQDRLYYTGDGKPKMRVSGTVFDLAVPGPAVALTASTSGTGTGDIAEVLYVYTFVTDYGEESEPSPASNRINWQSGLTITLAGFAAAPAGRAISKQRLYRLQQSASQGADLFFIAERTASGADWTDTIAIDSFGEVLPSRTWNQPPDDLAGLIALPNGMMAAFSGKDLYFCEPYHPHAWPQDYVLTMSHPIVALGAFGNTIVVATTGQPEIVTGTSPDSMQQEKMELNLPCVNARGMVDLGYAVAYPSHDGLVVVDSSGPKLKNDLFTRPQWQKTSPATYVASQFAGRYFASYEYIDALGKVDTGTFIIDLTGEQPFLLRAGERADAMFYDIETSALYMLVGTDIYEWDAQGQLNAIMTWRSKPFVLTAPASFGAILVEANPSYSAEEQKAIDDAKAAILAANTALFAGNLGGELNGAAMNTYAIDGDPLQHFDGDLYASVQVFADGELVASIGDTNVVERIPPAKARNWEVQVNGTLSIAQISLATTARELNDI